MKNITWELIVLLLLLIVDVAQVFGEDLTLNTGGKVYIELVNSEAVYGNTLILVSPEYAGFAKRNKVKSISYKDNYSRPANGCAWNDCSDYEVCFPGGYAEKNIMVEKKSRYGCRVELDADIRTDEVEEFAEGTTLKFKLCAQTDADSKCDYVWSSNPSENSNDEEHVKIEEKYPQEYPGQIYEMAWEDKPLSEDEDFDDLVAWVRINMDRDGDGLWDDWEKHGIDTNGDDISDLTLEGANPNHKDIYLEIDYMDCTKEGGDCKEGDNHTHRPEEQAIALIKDAFANGKPGITLHVDLGEPIIHKEYVSFDDETFDNIKATHFNEARRFAYHYVLFSHALKESPGNSGQAERPGNDIIVSLGNFGWVDLAEKIRQQAGTLMHELGHNLSLKHGGGDCINYKPNYLSIMNYPFQYGIPPTKRLDYSKETLPTLDEKNGLDEPDGIQDGTDETEFTCPVPADGTEKGNGIGPIDWNCDGDEGTDRNVRADINNAFDYDQVKDTCDIENPHDPPDCLYGKCYSLLDGFDDWNNLELDLQTAEDFEDGVHLNLDIPEMDYETYLIVTNTPPTAVAGDNQMVECNQEDGATVTLDGSESFDTDENDFLTYTWEGPFQTLEGEQVQMKLPLGLHCVVLRVNDSWNGTSADKVCIDVTDTTPPTISLEVSPKTLWPPDHTMREVSADIKVTDICDPEPAVELYTLNSSEPDNDTGDGDQPNDIQNAVIGTDDREFNLRAERSGTDSGRTYTVTYHATDKSGNTSETSAAVTIPHNQ
jgi:hypothetical protein